MSDLREFFWACLVASFVFSLAVGLGMSIRWCRGLPLLADNPEPLGHSIWEAHKEQVEREEAERIRKVIAPLEDRIEKLEGQKQ